jgi:hypothetical protein
MLNHRSLGFNAIACTASQTSASSRILHKLRLPVVMPGNYSPALGQRRRRNICAALKKKFASWQQQLHALQANSAFSQAGQLTGTRLLQPGFRSSVQVLPCFTITARHQRGLTRRSSRAPTAGHQARAGCTRYIVASPGLASHRRCRLSSNVRPRKTQPTRLFQRHLAAELECKGTPFHRSSEEHRVALKHAEPEGTAKTNSDTGFARVKQSQVPSYLSATAVRG